MYNHSHSKESVQNEALSASIQVHRLCPELRERFEALDKRLLDEHITPRSLCPGKERSTSWRDLGQLLIASDVSREVADAFVDAMQKLQDATLTHFPNNLYWDHDCIAQRALHCAVHYPGDTVSYLEAWGETVSTLYALFGEQSPICFQYTHDFLYGFDSTRWSPAPELALGEQEDFSLSFLLAIKAQGERMIELIEGGDPSYPEVPQGSYRNSYPFDRQPAIELHFMQELAERGLIPLESWSLTATRTQGFPYLAYRNRLAKELGLKKPVSPK